MGVDRASDRPVYKQLADALRGMIRGGDLAGGQLLPSETELIRRYGVSRNSVRAAVRVLRGEGLVVTEHGRGSFVRPHRPLRRLGSPRHVEADENDADWRLLGVEVVEPSTQVASRLGSGELVLVRRYLLVDGGEPIQLVDRYLPLRAAQPASVEEPAQRTGDVGVEPQRVVEELVVRMPSLEQARRLRLSGGVPVVHLLRTSYDAAGRALEVADCVLAGDRHALVYEIPAN